MIIKILQVFFLMIQDTHYNHFNQSYLIYYFKYLLNVMDSINFIIIFPINFILNLYQLIFNLYYHIEHYQLKFINLLNFLNLLIILTIKYHLQIILKHYQKLIHHHQLLHHLINLSYLLKHFILLILNFQFLFLKHFLNHYYLIKCNFIILQLLFILIILIFFKIYSSINQHDHNIILNQIIIKIYV